MKLLVTGGTGLIGRGLLPVLLETDHEIRLLSRHAERDASPYPARVEGWEADVTRPETLEGAAEGVDLVLHITGIGSESPPETTFQGVNVDGTRHMLAEAERARVGRFLFVSSLGAGRGQSDYHRSKRAAEELVHEFRGDWTIVRPGNVYGPGDEALSPLLVLVRALPAIPVLDDGDQRFQPIWYEDLGRALVAVIERDDLHGRTLLLGGDEVTTLQDLLDRIERIDGSSATRVSVPNALASLGAALAGRPRFVELVRATGMTVPIGPDMLTMLEEENFVRADEQNALQNLVGGASTTLDEGIARLSRELRTQGPDEGVGALERRRFDLLLAAPAAAAEELMEAFRAEWKELLAVEVEDGPTEPLAEGDTLSLRLPARGKVQVRVERSGPGELILTTVRGHPLSGMVRFAMIPEDEGLRLRIDLVTRSSNLADLALMRIRGHSLQRSAWHDTLGRLAERSGGEAPGEVEESGEELDGEEARAAEAWIAGRVSEGE